MSLLFNMLSRLVWRRQWHPTPVLLPGKSHGWRSLVGLWCMGSLGVGHDWVTSLSLFSFMHWRRKWWPTPLFLPGESQGRWSLVGCHLWGHKESDTTERLNRTELAPSRVLWSRLLHYSLLTDSFISSRSLLNISCIFLILVSSLFMCNSILFPRFWIICTNIILNSFQGDSLSPPLLFGLVGFTTFLHLLNISQPFHFA